MKNIDTYFTKEIPNYKIEYHFNKNNIFYSSLSHKNKNKNKKNYFPSAELEKSNIKSDNKKPLKNIYLSFNKSSNTLNSNTKINNTSYDLHNNKKEQINKSPLHFSNINNLNISNISNRNNNLNVIPIIPNSKYRKKNEPKEIIDNKLNNVKKNRKLSFINVSKNNQNLEGSYQRHNHSFFEVKSLTKDFSSDKKNNLSINIKNNNSRVNYLYPDKIKEASITKTINTSKDNNNKNYKNKVLNINYNINNNINLIINSKKIKYIPKNNEFILNKNKISLKNISSNRLIKTNIRNEITPKKNSLQKINKINSYFFSYIPKTKKEMTKLRHKKKKKLNKENKLLLQNLNSKIFEEDFPIKIKYNRIYRINRQLKPQIALRLTLFKLEKEENERYFFVNIFYSENIRYPSINNKSEFYF